MKTMFSVAFAAIAFFFLPACGEDRCESGFTWTGMDCAATDAHADVDADSGTTDVTPTPDAGPDDDFHIIDFCYANTAGRFGVAAIGFAGTTAWDPIEDLPFDENGCTWFEASTSAVEIYIDIDKSTSTPGVQYGGPGIKPVNIWLDEVLVPLIYVHPGEGHGSGWLVKGSVPSNQTPAATGCANDAQCLNGYRCSGGQCVANSVSPPATSTCTSNAQCLNGYHCSGGQCVANTTNPPTTTSCPSTPCASGQTCQNGVCVAPTAKQVTIKACWAGAKAGWLAHVAWDYPNLPWKLEWKAWNLPLDAAGCASYLLPAGISQVNVDGSWKPVVQAGDGWFGEALAPTSVKLDGVAQVIPKYGYDWKGEGIGYPFFISN